MYITEAAVIDLSIIVVLVILYFVYVCIYFGNIIDTFQTINNL